jgi:LacI family transcriptional regulator
LIRFGRSVQKPRVHIVGSDHVSNTILAFNEIRARGYERVGLVSGLSRYRGHWFEAGFLFAQRFVEKGLRLPILNIDDKNPMAFHEELTRWLKKEKPDAVFTDIAALAKMLKTTGYRVPEDLGLAVTSVLDGNADSGINQNAEEIGRVGMLEVMSLINDNARGIPPIFRQILVEGNWVDGTSLPRR